MSAVLYKVAHQDQDFVLMTVNNYIFLKMIKWRVTWDDKAIH